MTQWASPGSRAAKPTRSAAINPTTGCRVYSSARPWTWAASQQPVEPQANWLGGKQSADRVVIWLGKFGVVDVFDTNQYAHDPRADFLNWGAIDAGSFDYAADAWGYTVGAAVEWYQGAWTYRAGVFDLSNVPNSAHLEPGLHEFQTDVEIEHRHEIAGRPGRLLLTVFDSRGRMGLLDEAVQVAQSSARPWTSPRCGPTAAQRRQHEFGTTDLRGSGRVYSRRQGGRQCGAVRIYGHRPFAGRGVVAARFALASQR